MLERLKEAEVKFDKIEEELIAISKELSIDMQNKSKRRIYVCICKWLRCICCYEDQRR